MAILIILSGKYQGKRLALPEGDVVVGRDETCQIRLATEEVSRQHCRIRCQGDQITIADLGSRNGTLVNDVVIPGETPLKPGDTLRVGPVAFQLAGKKPSGAAVAFPNKKAPSDDSILDWLADEAEEPNDGGDTRIVTRDPAPRPAEVSTTPAEMDTDVSRPTPLPSQKKFKSIGAEGEDIIQRHFELVQAGKLPKRVPVLKPK
jgi:predicted component of type VI protein secretion system